VFLTGLQGREYPFWATFNQVRKASGAVHGGEQGTIIVFWRPILEKVPSTVLIEGEKQGEEAAVDAKPDRTRAYVLRYHYVFNLEQTNIDWKKDLPKPEAGSLGEAFSPIEACEKIAAWSAGPRVEVTSVTGPCYSPTEDLVMMPLKSMFVTEEYYYLSLFHELVHSTGHSTRLNRLADDSSLWQQKRAKEELVAQMGAAFLGSVAGVKDEFTVQNSAAYAKSWISVLENDKTMVVKAASQAQRAADMILGEG
jgi:antirestriction protein ArdC